MIAGAFVDFLDQGYVYKGLKPVNWCIHDRTALAEAEVEYEDHTSPSIWVRFALTSDPAAIDPALAGRKVYGLIWTTTPWTIPANMAIAFHPKFEYAAVDVDDDVYIVAADLLEATAEKCGWSDHRGPRHASPAHASKRAVFRHPFLDRDSLGILADHVTLEQGTGAVHTAPGHGQEDYVVGLQYGIATYLPGRCRAAASSTPKAPPARLPEELIGKTVWEGNPHRHRNPESARRAAAASKRSSTPIRTAGAATTRPSSAPPSSGSSAWTATISASARSTPSSASSGCPPGAKSASPT